ncbi:MAG TPA: SDR family NAD(P)-dependent oxidoreductase [Jatrophihabitans sp.]|nr:SDR family NAD(P)-dependent oxidoreductase [Jatrophihabitans sp.]
MTASSCSRKHVLVTGSNSGIGRATVGALAARGWHVFAGLHHADHPGDPYDERHVTSLTVDVTDENSLVAAGKTVREHVGAAGLDALVDNAGIGVAGPLEVLPLERLRTQLEVNVIGQVAVTQHFLPLIRQAAGRIVLISSIGDRMAMPFAGPLTASKAALSMVGHSLRQELAPWGIGVTIVAPALIHTDAADKLQRDADRLVAGLDPDARQLYGETFSRMVSRAVAQEKTGSPPTAVAEAVVRALTARRSPARVVAGKGGRLLSVLSRLPAPVLDAIRRRLFRLPAPGSFR